LLMFFFFYWTVFTRDLHSFPTRRSSDLWWWENFASDARVHFPGSDGWRHILEFIPNPEDHVWFIVEDDSLPFYPVYDANPSALRDRKSTRLNSSHVATSYAAFSLKKKTY